MTAAASTAQDMVAMLRRHYLPEGRQPGGIFAPEIQAPTSTRRADLIWMPVTIAGRLDSGLVGHEIKVSRQDVLVELQDPTKADAWMRYCDRWWLVVLHPSLVDGLDLPPTWGVMAPPSGRRTRSMTIVHPAPALQPVDPAPAYETIARWLHWRHFHQGNELERERRYRESAEARAQRAQEQLDEAGPYRKRAEDQIVEEIVRDVVATLGGTPGHDLVGTWRQSVGVHDVVRALTNLGTVYERARQVAAAGQRAAAAHRDLLASAPDRAAAELAKAVAAIPQPREAAS